MIDEIQKQSYNDLMSKLKIINDLRNNLQRKLALNKFTKECEILEEVLIELNNFYSNHSVYILIKNPLINKKYYLANDFENSNHITESFRLGTKAILPEAKLLSIVGSYENLKKMKGDRGKEQFYNGERIDCPDNRMESLMPNCQSWLGATIYYPTGFLFGHIVIHSTENNIYYEHDVDLIDGLADLIGLVIGEYRIKRKLKYIATLNESIETDVLYERTQEYLKSAYGLIDFHIWVRDKKNTQWRCKLHTHDTECEISQDTLDRWANQLYRNERTENDHNPHIQAYQEKKFLVVPLYTSITDTRRIIGFFLIETADPGSNTVDLIEEVASVLGFRINSIRNQERYEALAKFGTAVSQAESNQLSLDILLNLTREHVSNVMFSENMYIALYHEVEDTISFPLIYRNGNVWKEMHNQKRKIDPTKLGRTEVIIRKKEHLLIKTKAGSLDWYAEPNHKEHANNPLASWIGVPIFAASEGNEQKVRGVIAAYHDELDHVYSIRDVFFLQNVAGAVSGLFRLLDLKDANQQLEEAKQYEQKLLEESASQEELAKTFILKQLRNRVTDSILDLERAINFSIDDIDNYQRFKENSSLLRDTLLLQKDAKQSVTEIKQAIKDTSPLDANIKESVNVSSLFEGIIEELKGYQYLIGNIEKSVELLANRENCYIAMFSFLRNVINFLQQTKIQAKYKLYKYKKENSIFIDIELDVPEKLLNELQSSALIAQKRIGANISLHEKNTIRFAISLNSHEDAISIIGGKTVDKRTLQDTLSKLGEKSRLEDDITSESHSKVIFILDNRKFEKNSHHNAKIIAFTQTDNVDKVIDKTKLDNENYLRDLLKDIKYYD